MLSFQLDFHQQTFVHNFLHKCVELSNSFFIAFPFFSLFFCFWKIKPGNCPLSSKCRNCKFWHCFTKAVEQKHPQQEHLSSEKFIVFPVWLKSCDLWTGLNVLNSYVNLFLRPVLLLKKIKPKNKGKFRMCANIMTQSKEYCPRCPKDRRETGGLNFCHYESIAFVKHITPNQQSNRF